MTARPITLEGLYQPPERVYPPPIVGPETLAGRLWKARKRLGWTQWYLAERCGTSQAVIQKIENGKSLRPRLIEKIASELGTTPWWLMFGVTGNAWPTDVEGLAEKLCELTVEQRKTVSSMIDVLTRDAA